MTDKIQKDQKQFFNDYAMVDEGLPIYTNVVDGYINKEQHEGFKWIENCRIILDYGCGTATSIDRFFSSKRPINNYHFIGVDIADLAVKKAQEKYPRYEFYTTEGAAIPQVENSSLDAAYIIHVLHHSKNHRAFFDEIYSKLKPGGKLLINDLSSNNPIINLGRLVFGSMPKFIKMKFSRDLFVEDEIPDKYPVSIRKTVNKLEKAGFRIIKVGYGHLFFFVFTWIDNFRIISNYKFVESLYKFLISVENNLLKLKFFQSLAELFYVYAVKPDAMNELNIPASGDYSASFNRYVYAAVPPNTKCLDVGCWNGNLGHQLVRHKNCVVDGIDVQDDMLAVSKKRGYTQTFNINLNNDNYSLSEIHGSYDVIVFADILEHLINPDKTLENFKSKLHRDGIIIVSLPNVAFILNRLNLLLGRWNYTEFGTLDKTHLKFFTIETARKLLSGAGYKVIEIQPYNQFGILEKMNFIFRHFPTLFAYQILLVARNKNGQ